MKPKTIVRKPTYILFYKPFGVLCQFTGEVGRKTLAAFGPFPPRVYPVGRLDADSEGLLLLSDDGETKHFLLDPRFGHSRTYLVQVEGIPDEQSLSALRSGVVIEGTRTRPAEVTLLREEPQLPPRPVPVRFRKNKPTSWIELILTEGRNRQVRKMTAAVGLPTLRLIRAKLGKFTLQDLQPGEHRHLTETEVKDLLTSVSRHSKASKRTPRQLT